jgi:molybdate transport system ATP-binding protein
MALDAEFSLAIGPITVEARLSVGEEVVAILGPNGAGKTTLLRTLAGLVAIDSGHIEVDGQVLDDPLAGVFVPPERRPIGMVFQDYLLFPFLTCQENVAFGLRSRKVPRREAARQADEWLTRVGLGDRSAARPSELSGGQAQRVALARALATQPRVLLLDEPLAALDAGARIDIRNELRAQLAQTPGTRLIVTHDPVDAASLSDRVVIFEQGKIVQEGSMEQISLRPRSRYVADLVGLNFYRGQASKGVVTLTESGSHVIIADDAISGAVLLAVHPSAVTLLLEEASASARNHWRGRVVSVDHLGTRVRVMVDGAVPVVAEIMTDSLRALNIDVGTEVIAMVKATEIQAYRE